MSQMDLNTEVNRLATETGSDNARCGNLCNHYRPIYVMSLLK